MSNNYISNTTNADFDDGSLMQKNNQLSQQILCLQENLTLRDTDLKNLNRKLDDVNMQLLHQKEMNENQQKLLEFYKMQSENQEKENMGTKLGELNKKIEELTKQKLSLEKEVSKLKEELEEEQNNNEKLINTLTDKQIENDELEEKVNNLNEKINKLNSSGESTTNSNTKCESNKLNSSAILGDNISVDLNCDNDSVHEHLNTEETKMMKELYQDLQNEYDDYKQKSEDKIKLLSKELDKVDVYEQKIMELESKNKQLEYDLNEYKRYLNINENNDENDEENLSTKNDKERLYSEIEALQSTIDSLQRSKTLIETNNKEELEMYINERKEYENLYNQTLEQKNNLEKKFNEFRDDSFKKLSVKEKELQSEKENNKQQTTYLNSIIEKIKKEKFDLEATTNRLTGLDKKYTNILVENKKKFEDEKLTLQHKLKEVQTKYELDKENLTKKINDLTEKNEQLLKISKGKNRESKAFTLEGLLNEEEGGDGAEDVGSLKAEIEAQAKIIQDLKLKLNDNALQRLEAENKYYKDSIETLKKQLEDVKNLREKEQKDFDGEIQSVIEAKTKLANYMYDKEDEILYWKNKLRKLETKLEKMGILKRKK